MSKFLILLVVIILAGCAAPAPDSAVVQQMVKDTLVAMPTQTDCLAFIQEPAQTPNPTYTPLPTYTDVPTYTPQIIVVTATFTPTPEFTPSQTSTPTDTPTPAPTIDSLKMRRGDGFYLVGVDIAPGVWRSDGTGEMCYWQTSKAEGQIIDNHFGMAGGTAYISPTAFEVRFQDCGNWTWLRD